MEIVVKTFKQLTLDELYDVLRLRSEIFVVEQDCVYQDIDNKDRQSLHILGKKDGELLAYARCFGPGIYFEQAAIGRVAVAIAHRKFGYGHDIMQASIKAIETHYGTSTIKLSAQTYLIEFYKKHDFLPIGKEYLEDGIPHIAMLKSPH